MEYEQEEGEGGFVERLKESPRTVSAIIIILIVAAAIYAFSGDDQADQNVDTGDQVATEEGATDNSDDSDSESEESEEGAAMEEEGDAMAEDGAMVEGNADNAMEATHTPQATPTTVSRDELTSQSEALPESSRTDDAFVEVAQAGDGLTHVARRATTRYLSENQLDFTVTNEHRVYIEDYIKDNLERKPVRPGDEISISFEVVEQAVAGAKELSESQLQNLTKYSSKVTFS